MTHEPVPMLGLAGIVQQRRRGRDLFPVYPYLFTLTPLHRCSYILTARCRLPIDCLLILFAADGWSLY